MTMLLRGLGPPDDTGARGVDAMITTTRDAATGWGIVRGRPPRIPKRTGVGCPECRGPSNSAGARPAVPARGRLANPPRLRGWAPS